MANGSAGRPQTDLFQRRYGHLLPIYSQRVDGRTTWFCACAGGGGAGATLCISKRGRNQLIAVPHTYLSSGGKRSCGCLSLQREKRERPYYVEATVGDYNTARIDLLNYGRAVIVPDVDVVAEPQGKVLGGYELTDKDGKVWIVAIDDDVNALDNIDDMDEYYAAVERIIEKNGRVPTTN